MSWQEQRRLNQAAEAEQARANAIAAAKVEAIRAQTQTETVQAQAAHQAELDRQRRQERQQERENAWARGKARRASVRAWATTHVVDLLIYPLAVVSAAMAVPAMAAFGHDVYGNAAGYALPIITELGMWAFSFAVHIVRYRSERDGADRPVWALQFGVWSFATVAAGLNFLHGLAGDADPLAGVVMAVASVAGVMAHQLVTAAPRRSKAGRDTARIERQAAAKVAQVRRAAVHASVAEIDQDGTARLLFTPGCYRLTRSWLTPWRPGRLGSIALAGLPVASALETGWDALDQELADLINGAPIETGRSAGGTVATLDQDGEHSSDKHESTPIHNVDSHPVTGRPVARKSSPKRTRKSGRSIEELRAELHARIESEPGSIDPTSAESIRRALRCAPKYARQLRDTYQAGTEGGQDR